MDDDARALPQVRKRTRTKKRSYEVGYGKPPKHSQFTSGRSGNPRGRPKAARSLKTIVRETLHERVTIRTNGKDRKVSRLEALVLKQIELASKGDPRALDKLFQLYRTLVPEAESERPAETAPLSETDEAVLDQFRRMAARKATLHREVGEEDSE